MPVHPAAPSDVTELVTAYRHVLTSFADLAEGVRPAEWDLDTSCPGWSVKDHLAHVVHIEDYLSGSDHPAAGWEAHDHAAEIRAIKVGDPAHVKHEFAVWMEQGVQARRGRDARDLLDELHGLIDLRSAQLYDADLELDTPCRSVLGQQARFEDLVRLRLVDIWLHEQDIRESVGRPGSLDSIGASQFITNLEHSFGRILVKRVGAEPGTVVIVESTGPVTARIGCRVGLDDEGRAHGHGLFSGQVEEESEPEGPEHATTIAMSTDEFTRRAAGRRSTDQTHYVVHGDEDLARRVVDALAVTP